MYGGHHCIVVPLPTHYMRTYVQYIRTCMWRVRHTCPNFIYRTHLGSLTRLSTSRLRPPTNRKYLSLYLAFRIIDKPATVQKNCW